MASRNFGQLALHLANARINFQTGNFKFLLLSALPNETQIDSWAYRAAVLNEIAAGSGYATGGVAVTLTVGAYDSGNNRLPIAATDLAPGWTSATIASPGGILYLNTGNAATDALVQLVDFGATISSSNDDFAVDFVNPIYINMGS